MPAASDRSPAGVNLMRHEVFISYAAPDAASARTVCRAVEDAGIACWIAPRDVLPGEIYADAIVEAILAARAVVVLLSASANASAFVIREVERAVTRGVPVVPLQVDKT